MAALNGRFRIVSRLASGGMAELFLAEQMGRGGFRKQVAIKRIRPELAAEPEFVEMFLDEARITAQLQHPNVVQLYELDDTDGALCLVLELVRGVSLAVLRQRQVGPFPPPLAAFVASEVARALAYAHAFRDTETGHPLGIVHRDVSPQNILISQEGLIKLADFGIAKAVGNLQRTKTGQLKGKVSYASPEQLANAPVDGRTDIWALGVVLFELLTGRRLFPTSSEAAAVTAILEAPIPDAQELAPDLPEELCAVLRSALERVPAARLGSAALFANRLEAFAARAGLRDGREALVRWAGPNLSPAAPAIAGRTAPIIPGETLSALRPTVRSGWTRSLLVRVALGSCAAALVGTTGWLGLSRHAAPLTAAARIASPPPAKETSPARPKAPPAPAPQVASAPSRATSAPARPKRRDGRAGSLDVNTEPWSEVELDGRALGMTPLANVPLSPGRHRLLCKNPETNTHAAEALNVRPGQHITRFLRLGRGAAAR